ncbi:MAG TPA: PD-(D/E)XK nuclease family protein [Armatimonadota bacterium]|nr:PD-(D/E)XK nuclease family protein [Armatimonadota bacterium]
MVAAVAEPTYMPDSYHVGSPCLGASKIADYLKCPLSYRLKYVDKIPAPKSPHAFAGTVIHQVAHHINMCDWTADHAQEAADMLWGLWEQGRLSTSDPDNPEIVRSIGEAANVWLPWYLHWREGQRQLVSEHHWLLQIEPNELGCDHDRIVLEGTIDRAYREGGLVIVSDMKSGARKPSQADLDRDLQLSVYSFAARRQGLREDAMELVWLRTQETLRTTRTDEYLLAVMRQVVLPVARAIAGGVFPANPASKYGCGYCDHQEHCEVGRAA